MKISTLQGKERTIPIVLPAEGEEPEEEVMVTYRPGAVTLELADQIKETLTTGLEVDIALVMLKPMLVKWDLQNDDGSEWPCDEDHIKKTPLLFLGLILDAIQTDSRPDPTKGATLGDGLPQTASSDASQNGTPSSEQETDSTVHLGSSSDAQ